MGVLNGSITYTLFYVDGELPDRYEEEYLEKIQEFAFQPLLPESEDDVSMGWVRVDNMLNWSLDRDSVFRADHLLLSMRSDKWALPGALLRASIAEREEHFATERGRTKLSRAEKDTIRETVRREFKGQMLPSAGSVDMAWDLKNGVLRLWSQSGRVKEVFLELFESTFGLRLHESGPYMSARALELTADELKALADIEYTDLMPVHAT